jgi:hypothetical protein
MDDDVADILGSEASEMNAGNLSSALGSTQCPFQPSRVQSVIRHSDRLVPAHQPPLLFAVLLPLHPWLPTLRPSGKKKVDG